MTERLTELIAKGDAVSSGGHDQLACVGLSRGHRGALCPGPFLSIPTVGGTGELVVKKSPNRCCAVHLAQVQGAAPEGQIVPAERCLASGETRSSRNDLVRRRAPKMKNPGVAWDFVR